MKNIIAFMTLLLGLGISFNGFAAEDDADEAMVEETSTRVAKVKGGGLAELCKKNGAFREGSGAFCGKSKPIAGYVMMACGDDADFAASQCGIAALGKLAGVQPGNFGNKLIAKARALQDQKGGDNLGILCRILSPAAKNMTMSCAAYK